jgi:hypothetical protein
MGALREQHSAIADSLPAGMHMHSSVVTLGSSTRATPRPPRAARAQIAVTVTADQSLPPQARTEKV